MSTGHKFKNIIFYDSRNDKSALFRKKLEPIKFIKIFETNDIDEVQQIIDMSERAVLLVDDEIAANKVFKATLHKKKAQFKKYYLNWSLNIAPTMKLTLLERGFTLINNQDVDPAIERVELYLFGKSNVFANPHINPGPFEKRPILKKGYFTHLERSGDKWKILASSHESDEDISQVLGKDWDDFIESTMREASHIKELFETRLTTSEYHELVYPHFVNGEIKKLSIVHAHVDANYAENIVNIHKFLRELK